MKDWESLNAKHRAFLEVLYDLGGLYICPKDLRGNRLGRLVGYTAKYDGGLQQYVGDIYLNCAMAEQYPQLYDIWTERMIRRLARLQPTVFMGLPTGGVSVANSLARQMDTRVIYPDKVVTALATETQREQSRLELRRHKSNLRRGDRVVIAEDVINNLSTGRQAIELVSIAGAIPVAIVSLFCYRRSVGPEDLPVLSVQIGSVPQYRQDDQCVAADIAAGKVIWKPKDIWAELIEEMRTTIARR